MTPRINACLVHLLTASGAVFAMLALLAAVKGNWATMFLWLLAAFAVDGLDGPLALATRVTVNAKRLDCTILDLTVEFPTYVIMPAFVPFQRTCSCRLLRCAV